MTIFLNKLWLFGKTSTAEAEKTATEAPSEGPNGIVDGNQQDNLIDASYTDDPHGDRVDANDAVFGYANNDDIILARGGNDTVKAGLGDDTVVAGSGDDLVEGGSGDDILIGDGATKGTYGDNRESFEWSKAPDPSGDGSEIDDDDSLKGGFTQNTGSVNVTFDLKSFLPNNHASQEFSDRDQFIDNIDSGSEEINDESSFESLANCTGDTKFELRFDQAVGNVSFNVNDIDNNGAVKVLAYDASGKMIDVDLIANSSSSGVKLTDSDGKFGVDTATSKGGDDYPSDSKYSVNVSIEGPVSRIEFIHTGATSGNSGVNVTDVFFDSPVAALPDDDGAVGNDTLDGGEGDDIIFGDSAGLTKADPVSKGVDPVAGADHTVLTWDLSNVTVAGGSSPFRDSDTGSSELAGKSFTINDNSAPVAVGVKDGDDSLNDNDGTQTLVQTTKLNGNTEYAGDKFIPEYSYVVRPSDAVDSSQDVTVYVMNFDGTDAVGIVTDKPLEVGKSYDFVSHSSDLPSIKYDHIANTYTTPGDATSPTDGLVGGDDVLTGGAGNDTIFGEGGNDSIEGNEGDDYLGGNSGDDTISGGSGKDTIYGDNNTGDGSSSGGTTERESFEWDKAPDPYDTSAVDNNDNLGGGFVQDTGNVNVTFSVTGSTKTPETTFSTDQQKVHSITGDDQATNANSSLASLANQDGESATYRLDFSKDVTNISFRINDIDNASKVVIVAIGPDGTRTPIKVDTGSGINAQNQDGVGGYETLISRGDNGPDTDPDHSALVNIDGPVDYLEITHTMDQDLSDGNHAGINITDVYFDAPVGSVDDGAGNDLLLGDEGDDFIDGGAGDDTLFGGNDDDTLVGGDGNDQLTGGEGKDKISGGAGKDTIFGGNYGDEVDGGAGGFDSDPSQNTDDDTLDLTGLNFRLRDLTPDSNGNGQNGTVDLYNADGSSAGSFKFTEIEHIIGEEIAGPVDGLDSGETMQPEYTDAQGDQIDGTDGINDTIFGNGGDDTIDSGLGDDTVDGGSGDDTFALTDGIDNDVIIGGESGETTGDVIDSTAVDDDLTVTFTDDEEGTLTNGSGITEFSEIEKLELGGGDDTVTGSGGDEHVLTGDGNDVVNAGSGDDTIDGQGGDDIIDGGGYDDSLIGGDGNDSLVGGSGNDVLIGNNSGVIGVPDADIPLVGTPFDQDANPNDDRDTLIGGRGNDTIDGGDDADYIDGGADDDVIEGGIDNDTIYGGSGNDTITDIQGADSIFGGDGDDLIDAGVDTFSDYKNDQPTFIHPVTGETVSNPFFGTGDPNKDDGRDFVDGGSGNDTIRTGDDSDTIYGGTGDDFINAGIDDDFVEGGDGNDFIIGSHGSDTLKGNGGNDTIYGGFGTEPIAGYAGEEVDATDPQPNNGKDLIDGGAGDDVLYGEDDDDTIFGGADNDYIDGGIDDDSLDGGQGNDTILGGQGDDTILGAQGDDVIDGGEGNDSIFAGNDNDSVIGGNGNDTIDGGLGNDTIDGGDGDDYILGGFGEDSILGGDGDDTIFAAGDNDTVDGGAGNDSISGVRGDDLLSGGEGNDTINGGEDNDTIFGDGGDDSILGGFGDDSLIGGEGDDTIIAGGGDDIIRGGAGNDSLDGNDGRDTFLNVNGGDTINGGSGTDANDYDVINLVGSLNGGGYRLENVTPDSDPGDTIDGDGVNDGIDGTIVFTDASGTETGRLDFTNIEEIIPCFTPGTLIATPKGERRVEDLEVGDRVITRDNGIQEIRWVGAREMSGHELARKAHLLPVLIRQGALGNNLPERDMLVSPNHRVLVANDKTALYFEEREVLVAAKHLTGLEGVDIVETSGTTYIHMMFDQHEVILSDGTWTESFQPGDMSLAGVGNAQRNEILELFPELATREGVDGYVAARRTLKKHEAKLLTK
ncbi:MAG: Hint domain-containing protein [Sulfitobacter sp.]|uniref:Hint domain-containing protein n=1 Tax=Sulfitobacter sp. TaxID=1903071 RepID=UPI003001CD7D